MNIKWLLIALVLLTGCTNVNLNDNLKVPQCDNITDAGQREICYNNLAIEERYPAICLKIQSKDYRNWCLGVINKKPTVKEFKFD